MNENTNWLFIIIGAIAAFFSFRWLLKIFAGVDGKLDKEELKKLTAYILFIWAFVYILVKEGNRPTNTAHIFSEVWIFFIITALLTVLSMERIFDTLKTFMELIVRLRSGSMTTTKESSETTTIETKSE